MLRAAIAFFVMGLFAFLLGAYEWLGMTPEVAKLFLLSFFSFSLLSLLAAMSVGKSRDRFV